MWLRMDRKVIKVTSNIRVNMARNSYVIARKACLIGTELVRRVPQEDLIRLIY